MKLLVLCALVAAACADVAHIAPKGGDVDASVVRSEADVKPDGYNYVFETSNGIAAQASGQLKAVDKEQALVSQGSFHYTAPDGTPVQITYTADENGYQPQGASIPVPPPVPEYILRAIEWTRTHQPKDVPASGGRFA